MPKTITIDEIEEGMEVHSEVTNKFGQVLIGSGAILNEKHKKILKTWNIAQVEIKSDDQEEAQSFSEEALSAAREFIATKIKWEPRNKFEEELISIAVISAAIWLKKGVNNATA